MKHYHDEYTNRVMIECDNPAELRALVLELLGDYIATLNVERQEIVAKALDNVRSGYTQYIIICLIKRHYDVNVTVRQFDITLDL